MAVRPPVLRSIMKKPLLFLLLTLAILILTVYSRPQRSVKVRVEGDSSGLYYKDAYGVYTFVPRDCGFLGCFGPDLRLESQKYRRIAHADPGSFRILLDFHESSGDILARDRTHVFYGGEYVPSGDVNSLALFGTYAKDKNNLYYQGVKFTGIDISTARIIFRDFIRDRNGLYIANAVPPRKADLIDLPTFELTSRADSSNRVYFAQDKNFIYYSSGGTYRVEAKPEARDFRKLGCGYYSFGGQIYYSLYRLPDADSASFRVLSAGEIFGDDIEECRQWYAIDKNHRYTFETPIRADDTYGNKQVDLLLATPDERKSMSAKFVFFCIPEERPGTNFGFNRVQAETKMPGAVRLTQYTDARVLEAELMNADGHRQQLPSIKGGPLVDCNAIFKERFYEDKKKAWLRRRDPTSISFIVYASDEDHLAISCDSGFSIKMAFSTTALVQALQTGLKNSQLAPYDANQPGWGTGWILEDKFFVNIEGLPEIWIPLRIKNGGRGFREGVDFVTIGFTYRDGQFQCVDDRQCAAWAIPSAFPVDLR